MSVVPDPSPTILAARPDGSFRLASSDGTLLATVACAGGYRVEGGAGPDWWLEDLPENEAGWLLRQRQADDAPELGRTTRCRDGDGGLPATLLLDDGRLFRIVARWGAESGVGLIGDEVAGAYVVAARRGREWMFERTAAGLDLEFGAAGWVLLAAEVSRLDAV